MTWLKYVTIGTGVTILRNVTWTYTSDIFKNLGSYLIMAFTTCTNKTFNPKSNT
jgi:hypothetical protein